MSDEGGSTPVEEAEESWVLIDDEEQLELKPQEQEHSPREDLPETERPGAQVLALSGPGSSANQPVDSSSLNVQQPPPILQKPLRTHRATAACNCLCSGCGVMRAFLRRRVAIWAAAL
eukprot:TRINITY_DN2514_c0_g1_i2.p1 TRINITY_DN2514_c0_g1~~TRINITY_DN2514_c0_g1_i2.p1  ORF type:complete len:134 (+),score=10.73 TRINITY_DN2514_c0_g1_i2:50-403(+)